MYYEDENNLYHYSYRKGDKVENVRDVDYTEVPNTAATADPWEEKKPKKNRLGLKIAALALACALIGGAAGAVITHHAFASARGSTQIEVSDRQVAEVRQVKVDGKQQLTMPEVYAANVNSVVSINVSTTTNRVFGRTTEVRRQRQRLFHHQGRLHPHQLSRHRGCEHRQGHGLRRHDL